MASITITSIGLSAVPNGNQTVSVHRKLSTDSDASYALVSSNVAVDTNGNLLAPLVISSLAVDTIYTVKITNNCNGSSVTRNFTTPKTTCPNVTSITGTVANEGTS